ncbi:F-box/FBD/LRR-repeat protein At4g26340-like [Chenopodium quinoa]|uniref:F-box domain-containing protein n=1 Tax=Chenopodium quinoa TaxID=63459 RepID=A0A803LYX1_CHEQI|nr:F-box/FBD/LRR-repeat protein At4g26340-like [Chenopodium quinoa]
MDGMKNMNLRKKDRLSSLPDDILSVILSHLQINSVVATSILSRRWRYLWTTVTNFKFEHDNQYLSKRRSIKFSTVVVNIVRQLTSQKLGVFKLQLSSLSNLCDASVADLCFREICGRNVEQIIIEEVPGYNNNLFPIPAFLFSSQNLVVLILRGMIKFNLPEKTDIQLPNLRKISLTYLVSVPHQFLGSLFRSCQRLIDADLMFNDYITQPEPQIVLNISGPELRSLQIRFLAHLHTQRPKILIDAPELETLYINSFTSDYYSIQNPAKLVNVSIQMYMNEEYNYFREEDCLKEMFKFVKQMSSVRKLFLRVQANEVTNVYRYFNSVNLKDMTTFPNLERLETNLDYDDWKDLILSMKCFPNLRHLRVDINMDTYTDAMDCDWCVPECLSKLKTIEIYGVHDIRYDLTLLEYILSNALVLEKLHVQRTGLKSLNLTDNKAKLRYFCKSLFQLPRASSTCEIVFRLRGFVRVSSNDWKNRKVTPENFRVI